MENRSLNHRNIMVPVLIVIFLSSFTAVATGEDNEMLLDGVGIFLTTGETWDFEQGYSLTVKSVNQGTNQAWMEISLEGKVLREDILGEGETLVYSRDGEILNITLDTIYSSPGGELVTFRPVYQYVDPELPEPEKQENTDDGQSSDNTSGTTVDENNRAIPGFGALLALATATIVTYSKNKQK